MTCFCVDEKEYLQGILEDYKNGTLSIEEIEMKREIAGEEDQEMKVTMKALLPLLVPKPAAKEFHSVTEKEKKDEQFEYEDMPSTSNKKKQEPAIPSETSKKRMLVQC